MSQIDKDISWIPLLLKGDRKTIQYFVDTYGGFMYNVCYKILLSTVEAEEATQDAVMKAVKAIESYDQKSPIKAWCYTIAYRTAIDYKRKIRYSVSLDNTNEVAYEHTSDQHIQESETKVAIQSLLSHLDDESKMIVSLYYLEEKNIKEVVEITGLTESNIKIKLFRARKELARYAPKYFEHI
jgi:RNA polymerase sigma-70 factor (ECF subfamily)